MIYNINGNNLSQANNVVGVLINNAYDINGNQVWSAEPPDLKVMSYNVGGWYDGSGDNVPSADDSFYYALQNGMIQNDDADVLLIQEYWSQFSKLPRTAISMLQQYYPYIHEQNGNSTYFGRCICSKYPISDYTVRTYTDDANRYYDSCVVTINDVPITFVNTHLSTTLSNRELEIAQLIQYLQTLTRFVCCGDFNMLHCKATTDEDYIAIMQPILNAGFNSANCDDFGFLVTYSDAPTGTYTGCLDNIITSSNIGIVSASVDTTKLSYGLTKKIDHMPIIAGLTI